MHLFVLLLFLRTIYSRYVEGEINTKEDWIFLARFCFLSHQGLFEYSIEYNEELGEPNLLLYYDTPDQWPSVYKSHKTCLEKESVVHVEQNQIINLTARLPNYKTLAGCFYKDNNEFPSSGKTMEKNTKPKSTTYNITLPTLPTRKTNLPSTTITTQTPTTILDISSTDLLTTNVEETTTDLTTEDPNDQYEIFNVTVQQLKRPIAKRWVAQPPPPPPNKFKNRTVICQNARSFSSSRERWWFVALSNCKSHKGIQVKYKILMTNGPPGDYWHEHFSADEFYILPVLTAFCVAYTILLLGIIVCAIELKSRQLLHTTYKIFFYSVILQLFGVMLQCVAYLKYAMTGMNISQVKRIGAIFMGASETCFLLLLLLLAKGYTITRGRLKVSSSIKVTVFMCTYIVTYVTIFVYESVVFDPGEVLYLFESPAGVALIILRMLAWCMFIYSTVFTLKHYPEKGNFYYPFNICGTCWFTAGPVFILLANSHVDKWVRESVVCAVLLFIAFGGHLSFLILTMPSVANKNFPYHVRTTQIGVMEVDPRNGTTSTDNFLHHPYQPTEQTVIIPLTRRTEEIFEGMYNQRTYSGVQRSEELEIELKRDRTMENVLNWSSAKNVSAIECPEFVPSKRASLASIGGLSGSRRASQQGPHMGFADYIHDVPVELFTISRMTLSSNKSISRQNTDDESREK